MTSKYLIYMKYINILILSLILSIITSLGAITLAIVNNIEKEKLEKEVIEIQFDEVKLNLNLEDSIYQYILELNIAHPEIVLKQARLESANFTSTVFKENNNMFGFKRAFKRPNTQIGTNRGYAVYSNWKECVLDYALCQTYSAKNLSEEEYLDFLGKYFAEDINYINKINNIKYA